jgi:hypothetical protein
MAMRCCSASRPGDDATSHERAYLFLFFVSLLASWILRDRVAVTSSVAPSLRGCGESKSASCDHEVVTRVSLGTAMFFLTLAALMWNSPDTSSWRYTNVHRGSWAVKVPAWIGSIVLAFVTPERLAAGYFQAARVGGAAFLLVQIIVLLGTAYETNERWLARATRAARTTRPERRGQNDEDDDDDDDGEDDDVYASRAFRARFFLIGGALSFYAFAAACLAAAFSRFVFNHEDASRGAVCGFNAAVLSTVTVVIASTTALSLRKDSKAGLFTSGAAAAYAAYQALAALFSLPPEARCAAASSEARRGDRESLEIVALVLALAALAASVARAGSSHDAFGLPEMMPRRDDEKKRTKKSAQKKKTQRGVVTARAVAAAPRVSAPAPSPEGFGLRDVSLSDDDDDDEGAEERGSAAHPAAATYFHLVFASAAMYAAMALVGWQRAEAEVSANALDRGWGSVWVKIGAAMLGGALYAWTIIAPIAFPNREF